MREENWSLVLKTCQLDSSLDDRFEQLWNVYQDALEIHKFTALKTRDDFAVKHFIDALLPVIHFGGLNPGQRVIDIGTGGGFPGIVLALVYPETEFVLLDALQKRVTILEQVVQALGMSNVECIHGRAEGYAHDLQYREQFDIVVARALAKWPILLELCIPFVRPTGNFIAYQGPAIIDELSESQLAYNELSVSEKEIYHYSLPQHTGDRVAVYLEKTSVCADQYPRSVKKMKNSPLIDLS